MGKSISLLATTTMTGWGPASTFGKTAQSGRWIGAHFIKDHPGLFKTQIKKPFVIGAIIDLGRCLDLMDAGSLDMLKIAFEELKKGLDLVGAQLPRNEPGGPRDEDLVKRKLDCAVIKYLHSLREEKGLDPFESVRGAFWEGKPL